ncbi:MAG TPA: DUF6265 family protein [Casimicrobiaceae bacterium]|nr:DUF6265 family protein [Casimicrobiaceae bacterium]
MQRSILMPLVAATMFLFATVTLAQTAVTGQSKAPEPLPTNGPLAELAWLSGCWRGAVNQREFREQWQPLRGNLLVGTGHTVNGAVTQDFEYLRIELRADGVYYVALPSGQKETAFKLGERKTDGADTIYTFTNPSHDFPQAIIYRRASGGWLYVHVEGKIGGEARSVIYPFRRIDCEGGELIEK